MDDQLHGPKLWHISRWHLPAALIYDDCPTALRAIIITRKAKVHSQHYSDNVISSI